MKTVITFGTFDVFHVGHLSILQLARKLGERMLVGVSSDAMNLAKKGREQVSDQDDHQALIAGMAGVAGGLLAVSTDQQAEHLR
uniref:adenylyltransferase/cytidyltransferase family protein n=1 Tax=Escherichia coli TaxID=562 RepID=UPI0011BA5E07